MSNCEECGELEEKELYRMDHNDKWRCWKCYGVAYPKSYAGRQLRGEIQ